MSRVRVVRASYELNIWGEEMAKLYSIGEVLIDFVPLEKGLPLKDVTTFERTPGGAPANVAAAVAKFGGKSSMITKLGLDSFGDFLIEKLKLEGVETDKIFRTKEANTGLAFISLKDDGEREFSFYRNPSADLLLNEKEIEPNWFKPGDILHFCSVDLVESPMKHAHRKAIEAVIANNGLISFDLNIRLSLWDDHDEYRKTILEFMSLAHLLKISSEDLEFISPNRSFEETIQSLFIGNVQSIIFTKGSDGADIYLSNGTKYESTGYSVEVQDTTGAGDAFIGGFLYKLLEMKAEPHNLKVVLQNYHKDILQFANGSGALTTTGKGAISSLPTKEQIMELINRVSS